MVKDFSPFANFLQPYIFAGSEFILWHDFSMKDEVGQFQDFADRFNCALEDAGLSKDRHKNLTEVLTKTFGVSKSTISDWRNGKKIPSMDSAISIAIKLNVCVEYLLTGRGPRRVVDIAEDQAKILDIGRLDQSSQGHIEALFHSMLNSQDKRGNGSTKN